MKKNTKIKWLISLSALCLGALCVGCGAAESGTPVDFENVKASVNYGESYVLPVAMQDTNGFFHKISYDVKTKEGDDVSIIENSLTATDFSGYVATATAKIGGKSYTRTFEIGVTGIKTDNATTELERGAAVQLPQTDFYLASEISSQTEIETTVEYVAPVQNGESMQIHGYTPVLTDEGFVAEIAGTYTVTWTAEYEGMTYRREKTYVAQKAEAAANVLNHFDDPEKHDTVEANYQWHKEFEGEYGVAQIDTITVWPQTRMRIEHSIASYQEAGYKYVVLRMYFPDDAPTWTSMNFGNNKSAYSSASPSIVKGEWVNYYFEASAFYSSYAEVTSENGGYSWSGKLYQPSQSEKGAVAYIADAWMEYSCPYGVVGIAGNSSYVNYLSAAENALLQDDATHSALASEIEANGFVLELQSGGYWPLAHILGLNHHWKEFAEQCEKDGSNRYLKLKMYMPDGMKWNEVALADSTAKIISSRSTTATKSGEWVTYLIDLKPIYDYAIENDTEPWIYLRTLSGAAYDETLRNVVYFSEVCFENENGGAWTGDVVLPRA